MTLFDGKRLPISALKLDVDGLRRGFYSDKYFENIVTVLAGAQSAGYRFAGNSPRPVPSDVSAVSIGEIVVEAQVFNRRNPYALVAGVDVALAMLRCATGYFENDRFAETWKHLDVLAVEDGVFTRFAGDTEDVEPVIRIRGCYRDFALLETTILGVLTRASRIATNVYNLLNAAGGKQVLFFPARFDLPEVQPLDGYAYWVAVQRYNHDSGRTLNAAVSTDAQAAWWGGWGGGTVPHALIAAFLGDTAEAMIAFAEYVPVSVPRVALLDFNNDSIGAALATLTAYWPHYQTALRTGDSEAQKRWTLSGVRLDTSGNIRDVSLNADDPNGVNPVLVRAVRDSIDHAWEAWNVPLDLEDAAKAYCHAVKIVVSGGFNQHKIAQFEADHVPVDIYGVGSTFLQNDPSTNTDYTMDLVRVQVSDQWVDIAKVGRKADDNPDLKPFDLATLSQ